MQSFRRHDESKLAHLLLNNNTWQGRTENSGSVKSLMPQQQLANCNWEVPPTWQVVLAGSSPGCSDSYRVRALHCCRQSPGEHGATGALLSGAEGCCHVKSCLWISLGDSYSICSSACSVNSIALINQQGGQ